MLHYTPSYYKLDAQCVFCGIPILDDEDWEGHNRGAQHRSAPNGCVRALAREVLALKENTSEAKLAKAQELVDKSRNSSEGAKTFLDAGYPNRQARDQSVEEIRQAFEWLLKAFDRGRTVEAESIPYEYRVIQRFPNGDEVALGMKDEQDCWDRQAVLDTNTSHPSGSQRRVEVIRMERRQVGPWTEFKAEGEN